MDNLDVNRFGTRYTLYNANDAAIIVNTTSSLSEFYSLWNATVNQQQPSGLNLPAIVRRLRTIGQTMLDIERAQSSVGGRSFISLIVPQMAGVNEADSNLALEQIYILREIVPDLTILFWAGGTHGRFSRFVRDQQRDLFPLLAFSSTGGDNGQQILAHAQPVIQRIQSSKVFFFRNVFNEIIMINEE